MCQLQNGKVKIDGLLGDRITLDKLPEQLKLFAEKKTKLKTIVYPNGIVE